MCRFLIRLFGYTVITPSHVSSCAGFLLDCSTTRWSLLHMSPHMQVSYEIVRLHGDHSSTCLLVCRFRMRLFDYTVITPSHVSSCAGFLLDCSTTRWSLLHMSPHVQVSFEIVKLHGDHSSTCLLICRFLMRLFDNTVFAPPHVS
jgi:hypothetical protein